MPTAADLEQLVVVARQAGAITAVSFPAADVVVDPRVRLKCQVPRCPHYGVNLMCPPNAPSVAEFAEALARYEQAIIVQVAIALPKAPEPKGEGDLQAPYDSGAFDRALGQASQKLAAVVRKVESRALALGYPLAAGFTAGHCRVCGDCVTVQSGQPCRLAFRARPAMEAVGIDVIRTAARAGVDVTLADPTNVKWTGLVLID